MAFLPEKDPPFHTGYTATLGGAVSSQPKFGQHSEPGTIWEPATYLHQNTPRIETSIPSSKSMLDVESF